MTTPSRTSADFTLVALAALLLVGAAADTFLHLDPTPPPREMRRLAPAPALPRTAQQSRAFPRACEAWLADHVGLRSTFLAIDSRIKVRLLGEPPTAGVDVLVGRGGWLYYTGNHGVEYMQRTLPFGPVELDAWCRALEARRAWVEARGGRFLFVLAPNKDSVYPEFVPRWVHGIERPSPADALFDALGTRTSVTVLDLRPVLRDLKRDHRVYLMTDSHWNGVGAHAAYAAIAQRIAQWYPALRPRPLSEFRQIEFEMSGDLARMLGATAFLKERTVALAPTSPREAVRRPATEYRDPANPREDLVPVVSSAAHGEVRSLVMIHDSFGDPLLPHLAEHFSRAVYVPRQTAFPARVIDGERPDVVVFELAERMLAHAPPTSPPADTAR